ncbi:MAG: hypothetical protein H6833_06290 [Planctomycetes bacterium]|nr:hypothetical protein [Planctomycetota bacterium]
MAEEFYDFEKALARLGLEAEELKRLVSEGEIRAFRDGDRMRLRAEDVEGLRRGIEEGAFLEDDAEDVTEELVFEEDASFDDIGMATAQISEDETLLEETLLDDEMDELELPDEAPAPRRAAAAPVAPKRRSRSDKIKQEDEKESPVFTAISVVACLLALIGIASAIFGAGASEGVTGFWYDNLGSTFAGDDGHVRSLPSDYGK